MVKKIVIKIGWGILIVVIILIIIGSYGDLILKIFDWLLLHSNYDQILNQ